MQIIMTFDGRSYAGSPVNIVTKLRRDAIHMRTRDVDTYTYIRAVMKQLNAQEHTNFEIEGNTIDERCEAFLISSIVRGFAQPVFAQIDSHAIRVLRKARGLSQKKLASLLGMATATVNRWEAGQHLPSSAATLERIRKELFVPFTGEDIVDNIVRKASNKRIKKNERI